MTKRPKPGVRKRRKIANLIKEHDGDVIFEDGIRYTIGCWGSLDNQQKEELLDQYIVDAKIMGKVQGRKGFWAICIEIPAERLGV